jgi:HK97 gp10 family phage protein
MAYKSRIPEIIVALEPKMDLLAKTVAERVEQGAKDRVAVRTGKLRERIHVEREGRGEYSVVAGDNEVFYGHIVEHGGAHTPARPFLVPAGETVAQEIPGLAKTMLGGL